MYTEQQQQLIDHVAQKVAVLFSDYHVPAHGIDHVSRVVHWAKKIAEGEKAKNLLLCELAAWTHDIGRTREGNPGETSRKHHELSYEMLREWYREDENFDILNNEEKLELLYAVRYHWNDVADKYDTAWILRDADKLDTLGTVGVERAKEFFRDNETMYDQNFRNLYSNFFHIKTKTAKHIAEEKKLMEPVREAYEQFLRKRIEEVEL